MRMGATYVECSSKEMQGVDDVFELAVNTAVGHEIQMRQQKQQHEALQKTGGKSKKLRKRPCQLL